MNVQAILATHLKRRGAQVAVTDQKITARYDGMEVRFNFSEGGKFRWAAAVKDDNVRFRTMAGGIAALGLPPVGQVAA